MIKSGGLNDQIRTEVVARLTARLQKLRHQPKAVATPANTFQDHVGLALADNTISTEQAQRIVALVEGGKLDPALAIERLEQMKAHASLQFKDVPRNGVPRA